MTPERFKFVTRKVTAATFLVIGALAAGCTTLLDTAGRLQTAEDIADDALEPTLRFIQTHPVWALIGLVLALGVFLASDLEIPIARILTNRISLRFSPGEPWVRLNPTSTIALPNGDVVHPPVLWFRVQLIPPIRGIATACLPFLQNIEYLRDGDFAATKYDGSQQLRWANEVAAPFEPRDISVARRHFIDLISVDPYFNAVSVKWLTRDLVAFADIFEKPGIYKLTVTTTSANCGTAIVGLILFWTGHWDVTELVDEQDAGTSSDMRRRFEELRAQRINALSA